MSLLKNLLKRPLVQEVIGSVASIYIRFVYKTSRWTYVGFDIPQSYLEQNKPFITCFWHSRLLLLPYAWPFKDHPFSMLISGHKDGRLISQTVAHFGIKTISGSTRHQGTEALLTMVKASKQGITVGITPDGPRGPAEHVSPGTIVASYLSKADMIPVTYRTAFHRRLKTWDRFFLPLPFSRGVFVWGEPVPQPVDKTQFANIQNHLRKSLTSIDHSAETILKS